MRETLIFNMAKYKITESFLDANNLVRKPYVHFPHFNEPHMLYGIDNMSTTTKLGRNEYSSIDPRVKAEEVTITTHVDRWKFNRKKADIQDQDFPKPSKTSYGPIHRYIKKLREKSLLIKLLPKECDFDFIQCVLNIMLLVLFLGFAQLVYSAETWAEVSGGLQESYYLFIIGLLLLVWIVCTYTPCNFKMLPKERDAKEDADPSFKEEEHLEVCSDQSGYSFATRHASKSLMTDVIAEGKDTPILENEWINVTTTNSTHQLSHSSATKRKTEDMHLTEARTTTKSKGVISTIFCILALGVVLYVLTNSSIICMHCLIQCLSTIALTSLLWFCFAS